MVLKRKKNGDQALPKEAWRILASAHSRMASDLQRLLAEFSDVAEAGFDRAFEQQHVDPQPALALFDLVCDLTELEKRNRTRAETCEELAAEVRVGRPRKLLAAPPRPANALLAILQNSPRRPGRPREHTKADEEATFQAIEYKRHVLRTAGKTATIKAAIEAFIADVAGDIGRSVTVLTRDKFGEVKGLYDRGKAAYVARTKQTASR